MSKRVDLSLVRDEDYLDPTGGDIVVRVEVIDTTLVGRDAVFSIIAEVEVRDSRAVNASNVVYTRNLRLALEPVEMRIPRDEMRAFTYSGQKIKVRLHTQLVVDRAVLFNARITEEHELELGTKPRILISAKSIIEPSDAFDIFKNLKAISFHDQLTTVVLLLVGVVVVAINTVIGVHDQFSPENLTWLYGHGGSDGEGTSPLEKSLVGSGAIGAVIWFRIRHRLRQYMQFSLKKLPQIQRGGTYSLPELVRGRSRTPLRNVTLRVVACNMELGAYKRDSGSKERTVSFREPVRGVILYEATVKHIPAKVPIAPHFGGSVNFEPMFAALYPPLTVSMTHGLEIHWEVQLIHPEFVDQELVGPTNQFRYADFLEG